MKYEDIISAFGVNYLKGEISKVCPDLGFR